MNTTTTWQQDDATPDTWHRRIDGYQTYGYIRQYEGSDSHNWQAVRNGYRLSGIVAGRDAAMAAAEAALAMPIDEFNAWVAIELKETLTRLERDLLSLCPDSQFLPGYHAGYEAGVADTKSKIEAVLA